MSRLKRSCFSLLPILLALSCSAPEDGGSDTGDSAPKPTKFADNGEAVGLCNSSGVGKPSLRRLSARELVASLNDIFPEVAGMWTPGLSADPVSGYKYDNETERLVVSKQTAREFYTLGASLADQVTGPALSTLLPCSAGAADRSCAEEFVQKYGRRLYRRPLTESETSELLSLFDTALAKTDFAEAIGWTLRALLGAPQTLYRSEIGSVDGEERQLDPYEIASELSYSFAGTTPDETLLAKAEAGELSSPEALKSEAQRLLGTPRGRETLHYLFSSWLEYTKAAAITKASVPEYETMRTEMVQETMRYLEAVVFDGGGGLTELLTHPMTYPSATLASFYGFPAPAADGEGITRPAAAGIGVLAQGSILSTEAQPTSSSPTQRGLLVYENFLCRHKPEVPADVPLIPEPMTAQTTRERYEKLHMGQGGPCKGCHVAFDPIGFGFEHFDEVGRYRETENSAPIDASGEIPVGASGGEAVPFDGQAELSTELAKNEEAQACVSARMKTFVFGTTEACLGETEREKFMSGSSGFLDYLASLAGEPQFRTRNKSSE